MPARTLILLRHAKSSWDDPALDDHGRPLNARGRRAAPLIGRWLAGRVHEPVVVLCSSSVRTRETIRLVGEAAGNLPEPVIERDLYHAGRALLLDELKRLPSGCATAMLVGHQPGLGDLLRSLADGSEDPRCRRAYEKFPTAAAAVLEFDGDWPTLGPGRARFVEFAVPRDLDRT